MYRALKRALYKNCATSFLPLNKIAAGIEAFALCKPRIRIPVVFLIL
jgi:hypothetical protein